ncbi:MAG: multiubiquitin domain-containing protein [Acidimicrobiia bacterium]
MSETSTATTHTRKGIRIFINDQPYFAPKPAMTGRELTALAGVPEGNQLFLDVPGHGDDQPVDADTPFDLKPGMKFYDVPVGMFG